MKYKVIYKLNIGDQEIDLSVFVSHETIEESEIELDSVINQANEAIRRNLHIPIDVLNAADVTVVPAPRK